MVLSDSMKEKVSALIEEIKQSKEYRNYDNLRYRVANDPDLRDKVLRTREIRREINAMSSVEKNGDYAERLIDEYDNLCDNTKVHEFSLAELDYCDLYREIFSAISQSFETEVRK